MVLGRDTNSFFLLHICLKAIPRKIWLDKSGKQLLQWPIVEIEKLRANRVDSPSRVLKGGSVLEVAGVTATQVSEFSIIYFKFVFFI